MLEKRNQPQKPSFGNEGKKEVAYESPRNPNVITSLAQPGPSAAEKKV